MGRKRNTPNSKKKKQQQMRKADKNNSVRKSQAPSGTIYNAGGGIFGLFWKLIDMIRGLLHFFSYWIPGKRKMKRDDDAENPGRKSTCDMICQLSKLLPFGSKNSLPATTDEQDDSPEVITSQVTSVSADDSGMRSDIQRSKQKQTPSKPQTMSPNTNTGESKKGWPMFETPRGAAGRNKITPVSDVHAGPIYWDGPSVEETPSAHSSLGDIMRSFDDGRDGVQPMEVDSGCVDLSVGPITTSSSPSRKSPPAFGVSPQYYSEASYSPPSSSPAGNLPKGSSRRRSPQAVNPPQGSTQLRNRQQTSSQPQTHRQPKSRTKLFPISNTASRYVIEHVSRPSDAALQLLLEGIYRNVFLNVVANRERSLVKILANLSTVLHIVSYTSNDDEVDIFVVMDDPGQLHQLRQALDALIDKTKDTTSIHSYKVRDGQRNIEVCIYEVEVMFTNVVVRLIDDEVLFIGCGDLVRSAKDEFVRLVGVGVVGL